MPKIKTRETHRDIKVLDKASVAGERMKNAFIRSKDTAANLMDDGQITPEEYAEDRVQYAAEDIAHDVGHAATKEGKKLAQKGRDAVREHREHPKEPEQRYERHDSTGTQTPPQEAARQHAVRQTEARAAEHQQQAPTTEAEHIEVPRYVPDVAEAVVQPVPEGHVPTQDDVSFPSEHIETPAYPSHNPQRDPLTQEPVRSIQRVAPNTHYEQSAYVQEVPSPAIQKWQRTKVAKQSKGELLMTQPVSGAPETAVAFEPEVCPPQLDKSSATEMPSLSAVRPATDSFHFTGVVRDSKEIKTKEVRTDQDAPGIKQPTPMERGRQLAIKQAEKKTEAVRADQLRPESDRGLHIASDTAPISSSTATGKQIAGAEPKQARIPAETKKIDVQKASTLKEAAAPQIKESAASPSHAEAPVRADALSIEVPAYREPPRREIQKVARATQRQQTKGTIKTADRAEKTIKQSARSTRKAGIKTAKKTAKSSQKAVKTAEQTSKTAIKTTQATSKAAQKSAQAAAKTAQKTAQAARATAHAAAVAAKAVAKAGAAAVKAIIAGVKELVAAIAAAGWVAVVAIVLICLIGLILISPFGIFFSGSNRDDGAVSASAAVAQVNYEFASRLEALQDGDYDDIVIEGSMADWPEVLAVFAVKVAWSEDVDATDVATLDPARVAKLTAVFWDMNSITSEVETIDHPDSDPDDELDDSWTESILHITISAKTAAEMKTQYRFSEKQKTMLDELLENRDALLELIGDLQYISVDAESVMRHLPDDLSDERRKVVKTACSLVGKVNYFWGGKSLVIGWDPRWGTIQKVWADGHSTSGTYRPYGLDCSVFVDWVFYNMSGGAYVIGHGGGAASQHVYCRDITWEEAMPGDLVFYPGDEHVGIVGGWDEDGNLLIIHCSAGVQISGASGFSSIAQPVFYFTD